MELAPLRLKLRTYDAPEAPPAVEVELREKTLPVVIVVSERAKELPVVAAGANVRLVEPVMALVPLQ